METSDGGVVERARATSAETSDGGGAGGTSAGTCIECGDHALAQRRAMVAALSVGRAWAQHRATSVETTNGGGVRGLALVQRRAADTINSRARINNYLIHANII